MAIAYFTEGATDFTGASWSDATGFAAAALLVIDRGAGNVVTSLDQSANSIDYLDIRPGFSGNIGSASAGSLKVDADGGSVNRIRYAASGGSFYLTAAGNNTLVSTLNINTGGQFYGTGGIFTTVNMTSGTANLNALCTFTTVNLSGGAMTIAAGTAGTTLNVFGGNHYVKRGFTTINVYGGTVTFDADGITVTTVNISGTGTFRLLSGTITTRNGYGGFFDATQLRRDSTGNANVYPNHRYTTFSPGATLTITYAMIGDSATTASGYSPNN